MDEQNLIKDTRTLKGSIRLVDDRDGSTSIVEQDQAHRIRQDSGLDLIMVNPNSDPPTVKLADFGKLRYQEQKRKKEAAKKQRESQKDLKEYYFAPGIEDHDYQTKLNQIKKALAKNHDVRIGVKNNRKTRLAMPRGMSLRELSKKDDFILKHVIADLGELINQTEINVADRTVTATLKPAKS